MTNTPQNDDDVRIYKANRSLQITVGTGKLDEQKVRESQKVIDENTTDFKPIALDCLKRLQDGITNAQSAEGDNVKAVLSGISQPVMDLKANAKMFKYDLVSILTSVMLHFLESLNKLDKNALDIVDAHLKTLRVIVIKEMKGDGGAYGKELLKELESACTRYYAQH